MAECEFCRALAIHKFADKHLSDDEELDRKYTVALVAGLYKKGRKTIISRTTDYNKKGRGYYLNYCPSCGREIINDG